MSIEKAKQFLEMVEKDEKLSSLSKEFTSAELAQAAEEMNLDAVTGGGNAGCGSMMDI